MRHRPATMHAHTTLLIASLMALTAAGPVHAQQSTPADTATVQAPAPDDESGPFFTRTDAWLAVAFAAGTAAMAPFDLALAEHLRDPTLQVHNTLQDMAEVAKFVGFPGSVVLGTSAYALGRVANMPRMAAFGLRGTEAVVLSYAFVWTGKNVLGRARPDHSPDNPFDFGFARGFRGGSDYRSFPSGHTAAAFAVASAITAESRLIWPEATPYAAPILYSAATVVGLSRMYHNRHWASDAVMGAALGTFSGLKVVTYHHRNPDNVVDRWLLPSAVAPSRAGWLIIWSAPLSWP